MNLSPGAKEELHRISEKRGLELVIVYGSTARGRHRPDSDVDIAVRGRLPLSLEEKLSLEQELGRIIPRAEVCDLRSAPPLLLGAIAGDGKPLYEGRPSLFAEFRIRAMNEYIDYEPYFRLQRDINKQLLKELKESQ